MFGKGMQINNHHINKANSTNNIVKGAMLLQYISAN